MNTSDIPSAEFQDPQLLLAMPPLFKELSKSIPVLVLLALAERFGGLRMYVPMRPNQSSRLASVLDLPSFNALAARFGKETIEIPRAAAMHRVARDQEIVKLLASGKSAGEVAHNFGVSRRTVHYAARRQYTQQGSSTDAGRGH